MKTAFYKFEFGCLKIGYTDTAVVNLSRTDDIDGEDIHSSVSDTAYSQIREYLDGKRKSFDFPYELRGTEFQKKVWNALCEIPYGETKSYLDVARTIGNPKATRAVGNSNRNNPMWIVVPCHRVIGADGKLGGYAGGLHMKEALLELEKKHHFS